MKYRDFSDFRLFCILVCKIHQSPEKKLEPIKFWLLFSYVAQKCITTALTKKIERIYKLVHTKMPISERLLIVNSSHLKNFLKHILETGVNRKSEFRWVWKFCWDLSNVLQVGLYFFQVGLCTPLRTKAKPLLYNMSYGNDFVRHKLERKKLYNISFIWTYEKPTTQYNLEKLRKFDKIKTEWDIHPYWCKTACLNIIHWTVVFLNQLHFLVNPF